MRLRRLSLLFLFAGPTYLGCQLVDPASDLDDDADALPFDGSVRDGASGADVTVGDADAPGATPFCLGVDAAVCDGFDHVTCNTGSLSVINGQLSVDHPSNGGSGASGCTVQTDPTGNINSFRLEFDFSYQLLGSASGAEMIPFSMIASVNLNLTRPNDDGIEGIFYQLLLNGQGDSQFIAITSSPNEGGTYTYSPYVLASRSSPGLSQATSCHVSLTADVVNVTGTAMAVCGGQALPYKMEDHSPPRGISAPATVSLGYAQTGGESMLAEWSIQYDNVLFSVSP